MLGQWNASSNFTQTFSLPPPSSFGHAVVLLWGDKPFSHDLFELQHMRLVLTNHDIEASKPPFCP